MSAIVGRLRGERATAAISRAEFRRLRTQVICASVASLAREMRSPLTGRPISTSTIFRWEVGQIRLPVWASDRVKALAELSVKLDRRAKS